MATKKAEYYYNRWLDSYMYDITQAYKTYSLAKWNAFAWCEKKCMDMNGKRFRIISHNTFGFSVAWISDDEKTLYVETPKNSYVFNL